MTIDANPASDGARRAGSKQGQQTLAAILTAACKIASEEGLEQLSMRRLAAAVGMSKSGLYSHFTSKEELQLATIEHVREVFEAKVLRAPADDPDRLGALLERWLDFFERRVFPGGCFLVVSAVEFATRQSPVTAALAAAIDREITALQESIKHANETGELRPPRDPVQTAFELHSILMNTHALSQIKRDPGVFDRARTAIHTLLGQRGGPPTTGKASRP